MTRTTQSSPILFDSPVQAIMAYDFVVQNLRDDPRWLAHAPAEPLPSPAVASHDAAAFSDWCAAHLSREQIRLLRNFLRMAAKQQRIYKHGITLTPRAHLLVKMLAEKENATMSDVIERYLAEIAGRRYGLALRTSYNEHTGQLGHDLVPVSQDRLVSVSFERAASEAAAETAVAAGGRGSGFSGESSRGARAVRSGRKA